MKSKMPISARYPAAPVGVMPTSPQIEIQCCWIRPLVDSPQTKKVANSTQNTEVLAASRNVTSGSVSSSISRPHLPGCRYDGFAAVGRKAEIGRMITREQPREDEGSGEDHHHEGERRAPADRFS